MRRQRSRSNRRRGIKRKGRSKRFGKSKRQNTYTVSRGGIKL